MWGIFGIVGTVGICWTAPVKINSIIGTMTEGFIGIGAPCLSK